MPLPEAYRGWENTIDEQREQIQDLLEPSPSLTSYFEDSFEEIWRRALKQVQSDYSTVDFPVEWPMDRSLKAILTATFWAR